MLIQERIEVVPAIKVLLGTLERIPGLIKSKRKSHWLRLSAAVVILTVLVSLVPLIRETTSQKTKLRVHAVLGLINFGITDTSEAAGLVEWAQLNRYAKENRTLPAYAPGRVVFFGDSITERWADPQFGDGFFRGKPYVDRGISGQTTDGMVLRFRQDVINIHPDTVVILAGTNDIENVPMPLPAEETEDDTRVMVDLAKANHIRVILCSILPVSRYPLRPNINPADAIRPLNAWLREYAAHEGLTYVDYFSAMADKQGSMPASLTVDGVHPNTAGYRIMEPLIQQAIDN